jgi:hypothetical protein
MGYVTCGIKTVHYYNHINPYSAQNNNIKLKHFTEDFIPSCTINQSRLGQMKPKTIK